MLSKNILQKNSFQLPALADLLKFTIRSNEKRIPITNFYYIKSQIQKNIPWQNILNSPAPLVDKPATVSRDVG